MKITIRKLEAELCLIIFLLVLAFVVGPMSFWTVLRPDSESLASWFQRSGAITSIFSALAQFRITGFLESIRGGTFAESLSLFYMFKTHHHVLSWAVAIMAIWGALVWGYGDLLIQSV